MDNETQNLIVVGGLIVICSPVILAYSKTTGAEFLAFVLSAAAVGVIALGFVGSIAVSNLAIGLSIYGGALFLGAMICGFTVSLHKLARQPRLKDLQRCSECAELVNKNAKSANIVVPASMRCRTTSNISSAPPIVPVIEPSRGSSR